MPAAVTSVNVGFTPAYVARIGAGNGAGAWMAADSDGSGPGFVFEPVDITVAHLANQHLSVMELGGPNTAAVPEPTSPWLTMLGMAALTAMHKGR